MKPSSPLAGFDRACQRLHQRIYDRLWDGRGLYVGTYRAILLAVPLAFDLVTVAVRAPAGYPFYALFLLGSNLAISLPLFVLLAGMRHLTMEWRRQNQGRFTVLNEDAIIMASNLQVNIRFWAMLLVIFGPIVFFNRRDVFAIGTSVVYAALIFLYWCAWCIQVRPRQESRVRAPILEGATR